MIRFNIVLPDGVPFPSSLPDDIPFPSPLPDDILLGGFTNDMEWPWNRPSAEERATIIRQLSASVVEFAE